MQAPVMREGTDDRVTETGSFGGCSKQAERMRTATALSALGIDSWRLSIHLYLFIEILRSTSEEPGYDSYIYPPNNSSDFEARTAVCPSLVASSYFFCFRCSAWQVIVCGVCATRYLLHVFGGCVIFSWTLLLYRSLNLAIRIAVTPIIPNGFQ